MISSFLASPWWDQLIDTLEVMMRHLPPIAPLTLLVIEEIGVPLPVPSDVIIAYTGYRITQGETSFLSALTTLVICIMIGSTILYVLARKYGQRLVVKFGRFIHLSEESIKRVEKRFKKSAVWAIIIGRQIPLLRTPVTVFAGMSKVPYSTFFFSTLVSAIVASAFYLYLGIALGPRVSGVMHSFSRVGMFISVPFFLILFIYSLWRHYRQK